MAADIHEDRFYSNIRDCIKKIKKHEGNKAFYRGFSFGALYLASQYLLLKTLIS